MLMLSDFGLDLPPELTAQTALLDRTANRLLAVHRAGDAVYFKDRRFADLVGYLRPGGLLVSNDARVIKARFFGQKASSDKVGVLVERLLDEHIVLAQIRSSRSPVEGTTLHLADAFNVTVNPRVEPFSMSRFPQPALDLIKQYDRLPLPPYIEHDPGSFDGTRYQAVHARDPGAVAASTTGPHLGDTLFAKLDATGIRRGFLTLYIGASTFQPVRMENAVEHRMHSEWYKITPELTEAIRATRTAGGRVVAVGITSMRALESTAQPDDMLDAYSGEIDIFITPDYRFRTVDLLVTNFHLPKSTLLMLVSTFAGMSAIRETYQYIIARHCRFFSYSDAILLTRAPTEPGEPGKAQSF